jgi:putative endonuclease
MVMMSGSTVGVCVRRGRQTSPRALLAWASSGQATLRAKSDPAEAKARCALREGGPPPTGFERICPSAKCEIPAIWDPPSRSSFHNSGTLIPPNATMRVGYVVCIDCGMNNQCRIVYVIRSVAHPDRYYTGLTGDVERRLSVHNSGGSSHASALRPWVLVAAIEFSNRDSAAAFERYLKTGSGRAFSKRHFV